MKKVLVTGAAGCLGKLVIKYLLSEGKYEITALDLKTKNSFRTLRKYHKRVNVIYGDITDPLLIDDLVKEHDYIIHLAGIKASMSILKDKVYKEIDYKGCENIVRAITFYNPKCLLIYTSSTTVYGKTDEPVSTASKVEKSKFDYYTNGKIEIEELINDKLANFVIYRVPTILSDNIKDEFIYNTPINNETEFITANDCAYALVKTIDHAKGLNKKTYNLGGGEACTSSFGYVLKNILKIRGLNFKYLWSLIFLEKLFYGHTYSDSSKINKTLEYQSESLESYFMQLKRKTKFRGIQKILAKPFIAIISLRENKASKKKMRYNKRVKTGLRQHCGPKGTHSAELSPVVGSIYKLFSFF